LESRLETRGSRTQGEPLDRTLNHGLDEDSV
jgi:hypothetical protein